ncbi:N-acetylmuramoyl-L-alanine amidase LytC precursor [Clostridium ragsdalei P11]|uniref:N-acetylmuramoyl-L-alanine amidase LytC n=1 Tax=Clostridium ragsdalei P11 TaxID=1353534 RepID=A0A1A6AY94_9CLOT|nr:cell wall-binding repeat-containing protein [Clostridium ragsdalei]OBR95056.1 N-acetylmuramoyl-L-alanine amidase LytC precursor [Clostridium ragsdalei P11]
MVNTKTKVILAMLGILLAPAGLPGVAKADINQTQVTQNIITAHRIAGADRYATSNALSEKFISADTVIIAAGDNFPDALCAAPLAKKYNTPILLSSSTGLSSDTIAEITRLKAKKAIIIGGRSSVNAAVETQLNSKGVTFTRIEGKDRYETSLLVAKQLNKPNAVVVAYGEDFPDALSISAIASQLNMPIILSGKNGLSADAQTYIKNSGVTKTYVIGGKGVLSEKIDAEVSNPVRLSGTDRYATDLKVLSEFSSKLNFDTVYLANGKGFADALAGSAVASNTSSPVVLVSNDMDTNINKYLQKRINLNTKVVALGGDSVVEDSVVGKVMDDKSSVNVAKTYSNSGTFTGDTVTGSAIISAPGVKLKNTTITGDLLIASTVGDGNIDLDNVNVTGKVIVNGGGSHSINCHNMSVDTISLDKALGEQARVVTDATSSITSTTIESNGNVDQSVASKTGKVIVNQGASATLSGSFDTVEVAGSGVKVNVQGAKISVLYVRPEASNSSISTSSSTIIKTLNLNAAASVKGNAKITTANIGVSGASIEAKPTTVALVKGVTAIVGGKNRSSDDGSSKEISTVPTTSPSTNTSSGGRSSNNSNTIHYEPLNNAIKEAKTIEEADCTPEVYKSILNSIKNGEALLNNSKATQIEVDKEVKKLEDCLKLVKSEQGKKLVLEARYMFGETADVKDVDDNNYIDIFIKDEDYLFCEVMESKGFFKYINEHGQFIQLPTLNVAGRTLKDVNMFESNCNKDICNAFISLAGKNDLKEVTLKSLEGKSFRGSRKGINYTINFKGKDEKPTTPTDILEKTIKEAQSLKKTDYTKEAYKIIIDAVNAGQNVTKKENATTKEIKEAIQGILDAMEKANASQDKTSEIRVALAKLPETEEAANKMLKSELQPLLEDYETKVKESGLSIGEINKLDDHGKVEIANKRMADIANGEKVVHEAKFICAYDSNGKPGATYLEKDTADDLPKTDGKEHYFLNVQGVDLNNNIDVLIDTKNYGVLLKDAVHGKDMYTPYQKASQTYMFVPKAMTIGNETPKSVNIALTKVRKEIDADLAKLAQKDKYEEVTLKDMIGKSFTVTFGSYLRNGTPSHDPITYTVRFKEIIPTTDKTSLINIIKNAKTLKKENYTPKIYEAISNAIRDAEVVLNNEKASQKEVDNASDLILNVELRAKMAKEKISSIGAALLKLPKNEQEADLVNEKSDLVLLINEIEKDAYDLKAFGVSSEEIQALPNYERIDIAKKRVNLIDQTGMFFDQTEYLFGRYGVVNYIAPNNINVKVEKDEKLGEVFDGHSILDYIKDNSSKIIQPIALKIGDRVIQNVNLFDPSCKNDINAAFTSFVNKTKFEDVVLYDLRGKSFTATLKVNDKNIDYIFNFDVGSVSEVVLTDEINAVKALNKDKYTAESYKVLEDAITFAESVLKNDKVIQADIDTAYNKIKDAKNSLKEIVPIGPVDKTELTKAIEKAKAVKEGDCTSEIYLIIQDKIKTAEDLLSNNDATQSDINKLSEEIINILDGATKAKTDTDKIIEELSKLPESKDAAALIVDKDDLQSLVDDINAKIKSAMLSGVTDKEIKSLANYERLSIAQYRIKIIDQNAKIIDQAKYVSSVDYVDVKNVDVNNNIDLTIKDGTILLKDAIKVGNMKNYMKDTKKLPIYPKNLKVGDVTLNSVNILLPSVKKQLDESFAKLAGKDKFEDVTLNDLKGKSFTAAFKVVSSSEVITYTFNFK